MAQVRRRSRKAKGLLVHAGRKAAIRYGLELTEEELRHLANVIRDGDALFVSRKSLRVSCWRVAYRGCDMVVLYDRTRRAIVTFLPPDCWEVREFDASQPVASSGVHRPFEGSPTVS